MEKHLGIVVYLLAVLVVGVATMAAPFFAYADGVPPAMIFANVAGGPSISAPGTATGSGCALGFLPT